MGFMTSLAHTSHLAVEGEMGLQTFLTVIWLLIWVHGLGLTEPALQTLAIALNMYIKMYFYF